MDEEKENKQKKWQRFREIGYVAGIAILGIALYFSLNYYSQRAFAPIDNVPVAKQTNVKKTSLSQTPTPTPATPTPTPTVVKEAIKKNPPKNTPSGNAIAGKATTNSDGSVTTIVSENPISQSGPCKFTDPGPSGSTPASIHFKDETGQYAGLETIIKDYLQSTLQKGNEISALHQIIVCDAGATNWSGQYSGSYTATPQGDIVAAYGWITLNVYYYKTNAQFNDFMKLVFSHEYGHHYTLYHKWVDWDLGAGTRFPDSYYYIRPLSKSNTAVDYSLGSTPTEKWQNCDAEIIAEDYSYLYSGYGSHSMSDSHGLPSNPGTKTWLNNIGLGPSQPPIVDNPPTVAISSPANGAELSGAVTFTATANDDGGISKVVFYVGDSVIAEDSAAPYEITIPTATYSNGSYILKAVAYDAKQNSTATISVTFNNTQTDAEKPVVTINAPDTNPYDWSSGDLVIQARATDNVNVTKIEFYINGSLAASENDSRIVRRWPYDNGEAGTYTLTAKAYDDAGNVGEASLTINKH